ncbi:MAG: sulfatase-like hydrolase/transferase [Magnetococcales bacterium]|nr:sulfatase-like hydrolase/transferase [Magnetococcales bacterium]
MVSTSAQTNPRQLLLDGLVSLSLANLLFLTNWETVLGPGYTSRYEFLAAISNVLSLGGFFWLAAVIARHSARPWIQTSVKYLLVLTGLLVLWLTIPTQYEDSLVPKLGKVNSLILGGLTLILITIIVLKNLPPLAKTTYIVSLIFIPFLIMTLSKSLYQVVTWAEPADKQTIPARTDYPLLNTNAPHRHRVLLLVFDEMDYSLAFQDRPESVRMPEFDRLRSESLSAQNAFPPGPQTSFSMPSMFTGKVVTDSQKTGRDRLLTFIDGSTNRLKHEKTIFTVLNNDNKTTLRMSDIERFVNFGQYPADARIVPLPTVRQRNQPSLINLMRGQFSKVITLLPLSRILQLTQQISALLGRDSLLVYAKAYLRQAEQVVAKADVDFAYIHMMMPHTPFIYDRVLDDYSSAGHVDYMDNLVLTDHWLGHLRQAMEKNDVWDSTTLIITADHWYRSSMHMYGRPQNHRVPLLIKPAGHHPPLTLATPINTIALFRLIPALVKQELTTSEDISAFLLQASPFAQSPSTTEVSF